MIDGVVDFQNYKIQRGLPDEIDASELSRLTQVLNLVVQFQSLFA